MKMHAYSGFQIVDFNSATMFINTCPELYLCHKAIDHIAQTTNKLQNVAFKFTWISSQAI